MLVDIYQPVLNNQAQDLQDRIEKFDFIMAPDLLFVLHFGQGESRWIHFK